jgi:hypothetical protein
VAGRLVDGFRGAAETRRRTGGLYTAGAGLSLGAQSDQKIG